MKGLLFEGSPVEENHQSSSNLEREPSFIKMLGLLSKRESSNFEELQKDKDGEKCNKSLERSPENDCIGEKDGEHASEGKHFILFFSSCNLGFI